MKCLKKAPALLYNYSSWLKVEVNEPRLGLKGRLANNKVKARTGAGLFFKSLAELFQARTLAQRLKQANFDFSIGIVLAKHLRPRKGSSSSSSSNGSKKHEIKKFFLLEGGKKSILHISLQGNQDFFSFKTKPRVEAAAFFLQLKKISFISTWDFLRGMKQSYQKLKMASNSSHSFLSDTSFLVHSV